MGSLLSQLTRFAQERKLTTKLIPKLSYYCDPQKGKDNNFNLLRFLAAFAVLFGHCYALLGRPEPLGLTLGMSIGSIAVDIFFISSGFLVGASLIQRQSVIDYLLARFFRIFPALWMMLLLVVLVLGAALSTFALSEYYQDPQTYRHIAKSASLVTGINFHLPGLFHDNPYPSVVNGSLWTMIYELSMYGLLLLIWLSYHYLAKYFSRGLALCLTLLLGYFAYRTLAFRYILDARQFMHLALMFFSGTLYYLARHYIPLKAVVAFIMVFVLALCAILDKSIFSVVYIVSLPYLVFSIAYLPSGTVRLFNRGGDYSYGVYIYAFPLQQAVVALIPGIEVDRLFVISSAITLFCAVLSWHLLEKPVMAQRGKLFDFIKANLAR